MIYDHPTDPHLRYVIDGESRPLAAITIERGGLGFGVVDAAGQQICSGGITPNSRMLRWRCLSANGDQLFDYHTTVTLSVRITRRDGVDFKVHGNRPGHVSWSLVDLTGTIVADADVRHAHTQGQNTVTITHNGMLSLAELVGAAEVLRLSRLSNARRIARMSP